MSHTLVLSDALYKRLEDEARRRRLDSVESLLETWQAEMDQRERQVLVTSITALRERLAATYGEMPDSADLIREDRER